MRRPRLASSVAVCVVGLAATVACAPTPPRPDAASRPVIVAVDPAVETVLARSCYPCHSAERRDPWFAKLAPSSWGIMGGRKAFDLSDWPRWDEARRRVAVDLIADTVHRGTMPPVDYAFLNSTARLDAADRSALEAWAAAQR